MVSFSRPPHSGSFVNCLDVVIDDGAIKLTNCGGTLRNHNTQQTPDNKTQLHGLYLGEMLQHDRRFGCLIVQSSMYISIHLFEVKAKSRSVVPDCVDRGFRFISRAHVPALGIWLAAIRLVCFIVTTNIYGRPLPYQNLYVIKTSLDFM